MQLLSRAGIEPTMTVVLPGAQGALVTGTHGIGVSTPIAAEVADATVGFASDIQVPNVGTFTNGLLSMIVATGMFTMTPPVGRIVRGAGAAPNEHFIIAPPVASCMKSSLSRR